MQNSPSNLDLIRTIVEDLASFVPLENMMLTGAQCRDVLHAKFFPTSPARKTEDIDFAIAFPDWEAFYALKARFRDSSRAWQRIKVKDIPVDLVPFGELEDPRGNLPSPDGFNLNVASYGKVFKTSQTLQLGKDLFTQIPTVPGFTALKLHAWLDRVPNNQYKDGADLALILDWYQSNDIELWDKWDEHYFLRDHPSIGDPSLMASVILGAEVCTTLGPEEATALACRIETEVLQSSLKQFFVSSWQTDKTISTSSDRRLEQILHLLEGLQSCVSRETSPEEHL